MNEFLNKPQKESKYMTTDMNTTIYQLVEEGTPDIKSKSSKIHQALSIALEGKEIIGKVKGDCMIIITNDTLILQEDYFFAIRERSNLTGVFIANLDDKTHEIKIRFYDDADWIVRHLQPEDAFRFFKSLNDVLNQGIK